MKYFFHNIYGDAQTLIDTAEEDVIVIPFGWTEEIEQRRNQIINEIGVTPSSLPSVVYYKIEQEIHHPDGTITIEPAQYREFVVDTLDKPWTWKKIDAKISEANVSVYYRETNTQ